MTFNFRSRSPMSHSALVLPAALALTIALTGCKPGGSADDADTSSDNGEITSTENTSPENGGSEESAGAANREAPEPDPSLTEDLLAVIIEGNEERAIELVEQGAPIDGTNDRGVTVLHYAARATMPNLTRLLLEYGADVHAELESGDQPIHWAARAGANDRPGDEATIDVLLEYGADINAENALGQRPIAYAVQLNNERWRSFLASRGATVR